MRASFPSALHFYLGIRASKLQSCLVSSSYLLFCNSRFYPTSLLPLVAFLCLFLFYYASCFFQSYEKFMFLVKWLLLLRLFGFLQPDNHQYFLFPLLEVRIFICTACQSPYWIYWWHISNIRSPKSLEINI